MKFIFAALATLALTACSPSPSSSLSVSSTPEAIAQAHIDSILSHDQALMQRTVRSGSQAEQSWPKWSDAVGRVQSDTAAVPVAFRKRSCSSSGEKTICDFVLTTKSGDGFALIIHVRPSNGDLKVEQSLYGR